MLARVQMPNRLVEQFRDRLHGAIVSNNEIPAMSIETQISERGGGGQVDRPVSDSWPNEDLSEHVDDLEQLSLCSKPRTETANHGQ